MIAAVIDASQFGPVPPVDFSVENHTNEWIYFWAITALAVASMAAAVYLARRIRSWIPVMCMLGAGIAFFTEPMLDTHVQVFWAAGEVPTVFNAFGRDIPLFLLSAYFVFFGLGTALLWYFVTKLGKRFPIWPVFAAETLGAIAIEPAGIQMGLWQYYGFQGVRFFDYPLWWPLVGGTTIVVAGTLIYRLEPYLGGWRVLAVPFVLAMGVMATYWTVAWPMFTLMNKEAAHGLIHAGTVVTTLQALFVVWICSIATGHYEYRREGRLGKADSADVSPERTGREGRKRQVGAAT